MRYADKKILYDISPALSAKTAVWPGDTPLTRNVQLRLENGDSVELSSLTSTVHIGAHADAPSHYARSAPSIDQVALEPYVGPVYVLHASPSDICGSRAERVLSLAPKRVKDLQDQGVRRLLVRTDSQPSCEAFPGDFVSFASDAVKLCGESGFVLLGIDTPSVDTVHSKTLPSHQEFFKWGLRNLEGLWLNEVPEGLYELIALPLKLVGFDASPVRAILREL